MALGKWKVSRSYACGHLWRYEREPRFFADRDAVRNHFTAMIDVYRAAGYRSFAPVAIDTRQLGERAAFTTVRWHSLDAKGNVARDTLTAYHLLATRGG